ncbi:MAG: phage portal protein [Rhizomicrobium sp.]
MPNLSDPGARVVAVPPGLIARAGQAVRYAITGVAPATWFGPMQPATPMAPEGTGGRAFDYPTGYNLNYQPRQDETVSFATLHALADNCDLLRLVIETRKDQIEGQEWDVRPRRRADGTHPAASAFAGEIAAARTFFAEPDREHDLSGWIRTLAEELFVTDAASVWLRPDRKGRICAFEILDGATIAPRIDAWGRTPRAPDVAYQQILHGVPAADFSRDELLYFPRNRRPGHVYGYPPVEQVILTANTLIRRGAHQLAFYTDGNLGDGLLIAPPGTTSEQLKEYQNYWDSRFAGNVLSRRHGFWVANGTDFKALRPPQLTDPFDEFLARIVCFAFSISPQPFVSMMNRATADTAHDAAIAEGLMPVLNYFRRLFRILFDRMGWSDIEMVPIDDRETDPKTACEIDASDVAAGIRTVNEVRAARGLAPLPAAQDK